MALFSPGCFLRGLLACDVLYALAETLVRPCPPKKLLIYEREIKRYLFTKICQKAPWLAKGMNGIL
jgi:hypothetical protein